MSALQNKLQALFKIHPGEGRMVGIILIYAILLYFSNVMARTASTALFLGEFDAASLPYVNIGIAVVAPLISTIYLRLNNRYSLGNVLLGVHIFLFITLIAIRIGLGQTNSPTLVFILPIYFGVNNSLTISSFWNLLGRIYNLRQGKRLFSLLSSGEHIATIFAGFAAPFLVAWLGTPNLYTIGAIFMAATVVLLFRINRLNSSTMSVVVVEKPGKKQQESGNLYKDRYVLLLIGLFSLFIIGIYFVSNIAYAQAELRYPTEDAMAGFLGVFMGIFGVLSLIIQYFVAGRVLERFGVRAMLLATPVGIFFFMGLFAIVGTIGDFPIALFWLATIGSMYQIILDAVDSASVNIMYQPLPSHKRTQVQTTMMGIFYPLAIGAAGLLLLFFLQGLGFDSVQLSYIVLIITLVWIGVALALGREYPRRLQQALRERSLGGLSMTVPDRANLPLFEEALASSNGAAALYAFDMLQQIAPDTVHDHLPTLLNHPDTNVRLAALKYIRDAEVKNALPTVIQTLEADEDPAVRAAALTTFVSLDPESSSAVLTGFTHDSEPQVLTAALIAMICSDRQNLRLEAVNQIGQLVIDDDPARRTQVAAVLDQTGAADLAPYLEPLIADQDSHVRQAALRAAAAYPAFAPQVIAALAPRDTRAAASAALTAAGPEILPTLQAAFENPNQPREVLLGLAAVCGRRGGLEEQSVLLSQLATADDAIRAAVLAALNRLSFTASAAERDMITNLYLAEAARAASTIAAQVDIGSDEEATALLNDALAQNLIRSTGSMFAYLSFFYDRQTINRVWEILRLGKAAPGDKMAYAFEVLDVLLPRNLKDPLLPLCQEMSPAERLLILTQHFPQEKMSRLERILYLLNQPAAERDPWLTAVLLHTCAILGPADAPVIKAISSAAAAQPNEMILQETAAWSLAKLAGDLPPDGLLTTVQKTAVLKRVAVFAKMPNEVLAELASLTHAEEAQAQQTFITSGDQGDCLYIIVDGAAQVYKGDRVFDNIGSGEVIGEMALLDDEPRSASVAATTDTRLLRLDQDSFYVFWRENPVLVRGIIQILSARLRARVQDLAASSTTRAARPMMPVVGYQTGLNSVAIQGQLLDLQKVFILKGVTLFSGSDDALLGRLSQLLVDEDLTAGTMIFEKGDVGDSLYIVAAGQVRVHDKENTFNFLGEGEVFGEMALLDAEPRSASVTAVTAVHLLRLDQEPFYELLEDQPEIAQGIVSVLSKRLRDRLQELAAIS